MNKRILFLFFLLLVVISIAVSYGVLNQLGSQDFSSDDSSGMVTDADVAEEIDSIFLDEEGEIEIGEMV